MVNIERSLVLQNKELTKEKSKDTQINPRQLFINTHKYNSDEIIVQSQNYTAFRQNVNRNRIECDWYGENPPDLSSYDVPEDLKITFKKMQFYWDDSGKTDEKRLIIFTTQKNLQMLDENPDWGSDGTHGLAPKKLCKQLYTLHTHVHGQNLPMVYALLPNKTQSTYVKLFQMINKSISVKPSSINIVFEKATFNAIKIVWPKCRIYGCFFHLSQAILRYVNKRWKTVYKNDPEFRKTYRQLQALAFVPIDDVVWAFESLQKQSPESFKPILSYFERTYIGKLVENSKTFRETPRFTIDSWNLFDRVMNKLPRTNNALESWHSARKADVKKNLTLNRLVALLKDEQAKTDTELTSLNAGNFKKKNKDYVFKDENLYNLCSVYKKKNIIDYLNNISLNFRLDLVFLDDEDDSCIDSEDD